MLTNAIRLILISGLLATILIGSSTAGQPNWQLVFEYDANSLRLVQADRIPTVNKQVRTPGLGSAPIRLAYRFEWLDNDAVTFASTAEMPLGVRSTLASDGPCQSVIPEEGLIVVRVEGPQSKLTPQTLRLSQPEVRRRVSSALSLPPPFSQDTWTFTVPSNGTNLSTEDGPLSVTKIRDTGPDDNRLVIVVMGDGYMVSDLISGVFESAAASLGADIEAKPPWDMLFSATNMYRIDIESNERGADNDPFGVYVDTYLHSSYWVADIERLLALTGSGPSRAVSAANTLVGPGMWDVLLVLVNSTKYGGSGGGIAVSSVHSSASEIVIHELGHSFGHLADEYETPYPGFPAGDYEPNVDYDFDGPGLK